MCQVNTISTVIATENWIIKTSPYTTNIAHQSDTALIAVKASLFESHFYLKNIVISKLFPPQSDTHIIAQDTSDSVQYVSITVKPTRPGVPPFVIRVNAMDFRELQDRCHRPITILSGVTFNRSILERFVVAFKELITVNTKYRTNLELEPCFACMQAQPNIKLQKHCVDIDAATGHQLPESERCGNCFCRPMWCVDCLAKWFASRQNEYEKEVWLQQKCTCPMCRARFCMLDVCPVETN